MRQCSWFNVIFSVTPLGFELPGSKWGGQSRNKFLRDHHPHHLITLTITSIRSGDSIIIGSLSLCLSLFINSFWVTIGPQWRFDLDYNIEDYVDDVGDDEDDDHYDPGRFPGCGNKGTLFQPLGEGHWGGTGAVLGVLVGLVRNARECNAMDRSGINLTGLWKRISIQMSSGLITSAPPSTTHYKSFFPPVGVILLWVGDWLQC